METVRPTLGNALKNGCNVKYNKYPDKNPDKCCINCLCVTFGITIVYFYSCEVSLSHIYKDQRYKFTCCLSSLLYKNQQNDGIFQFSID